MAELEYRIWLQGGEWHWQVMQVTAAFRFFIASGVAATSRGARLSAFECCFDHQSDPFHA
ncbi:MAG TPA: hypothetical protein VFA57_19960 [Pseudolabrys sp.]|jgi:hypothetical protein|nr:hypothetical protein [Pseudolabrys sp.]